MNIATSEIGIPSINENNHCEPYNVDISGALFTLNLSILKLSDQYGEGARDVSNIRVTMITNYLKKTFYRDWEDLLFPWIPFITRYTLGNVPSMIFCTTRWRSAEDKILNLV